LPLSLSYVTGPGNINAVYLKGKVPSGFFHESVSPKPLSFRLDFFQKITEIFAFQGAPPASLTPTATGKKFRSEKF
jgi:hypothetical protein